MNRRVEVSDYLLGELSPEDRLEAERLIREDPEFRTEVERLKPVVARLAELPEEGWETLEPPPLRISPESLGAAAAPAPATETHSRPEARKRSGSGFGSHRWRLTLRPAMAGLCAAALVAIGVGAGFALDSGSGGEQVAGDRQVAIRPVGSVDIGATGTATFASSTNFDSSSAEQPQARIELRGMRPSPAGTYYELWLMNTATDLVSLGSFRAPASGNVSLTVPLPESPSRFHYFDISVERADGDPGHSGLSVMRAPA